MLQRNLKGSARRREKGSCYNCSVGNRLQAEERFQAEGRYLGGKSVQGVGVGAQQRVYQAQAKEGDTGVGLRHLK